MYRILFFPFLLVWFGCSATVPDWVSVQPTDSKYWHGIGKADKSTNADSRERAKEFAIHEISSQIKVNISSEMKTVIRESDGSLESASSYVMRSRVKLLLPELEFVGTYNTKDTYHFYARLNKQKYRAAMARLRENATETALGYIRDADANFGVHSFSMIQKAWLEIMPFTDEPILIVYEGKRFNLYSLIKRKMEAYEDRIQLVGRLDKVRVKTFVDRENSIQISVMDRMNNTLVSGIPVKIKMPGKELTVVSNRKGKVFHDISGTSLNASFSINFFLDKHELFKEFLDSVNMLSFKPKVNSVRVEVVPAKVKIVSSEKNLGRSLQNPILTPAIKSAFSKKVEFVNQNPDMIIKIESNTNKKSERAGKNFPFFTYGNASVIFQDAKTDEEFFSSHISNVKGGDFGSQQTAGIRAYEIMAKQIVKELDEQLLNH